MHFETYVLFFSETMQKSVIFPLKCGRKKCGGEGEQKNPR
jgi:hypothetical protein